MTDAMWTFLAVVFTAAASIVTQLLIARRSNNLMEYRIGELEKKMTKHNDLVERMACAERDIKAAFRLIDGMKGE